MVKLNFRFFNRGIRQKKVWISQEFRADIDQVSCVCVRIIISVPGQRQQNIFFSRYIGVLRPENAKN